MLERYVFFRISLSALDFSGILRYNIYLYVITEERQMFSRYFRKPVILFSTFFLFTVLVSVFDRQPIGAEETKVGFAALNGALKIEYIPFFAVLSAICGIVAVLICVLFAGIGLFQLISGKSIKKVDNRIILLGAFYLLTILFYVIFNFIPVNYRPFSTDGKLEISYPSSHTVLAICVFVSSVKMLPLFRMDKKAKKIAAICLYVLSAVTVISRFFSGLHWFTDIIGGIILSWALLSLFDGALKLAKKIRKDRAKEEGKTQ